jgi:hypothetical protein
MKTEETPFQADLQSGLLMLYLNTHSPGAQQMK